MVEAVPQLTTPAPLTLVVFLSLVTICCLNHPGPDYVFSTVSRLPDPLSSFPGGFSFVLFIQCAGASSLSLRLAKLKLSILRQLRRILTP